MNEDTLLGRLQELAPFADREAARRAFDATLRALRRGLSEDEADWLAVALGPTLSEPLLREGHAGELNTAELYRWMKRYTKQRKGIAVEQAQVVCRALAELLPEPDLERLKKHLPELSDLFQVPESLAAPSPPRLRSAPTDHTLAGGRPGSSNPISEAGGPSARDLAGANPEDLAQSQSVARARNPHGETKLSSARGLSSEREERTFARAGGSGRR
jgi:uncharacterized protein (DUF2267 family)